MTILIVLLIARHAYIVTSYQGENALNALIFLSSDFIALLTHCFEDSKLFFDGKGRPT